MVVLNSHYLLEIKLQSNGLSNAQYFCQWYICLVHQTRHGMVYAHNTLMQGRYPILNQPLHFGGWSINTHLRVSGTIWLIFRLISIIWLAGTHTSFQEAKFIIVGIPLSPRVAENLGNKLYNYNYKFYGQNYKMPLKTVSCRKMFHLRTIGVQMALYVSQPATMLWKEFIQVQGIRDWKEYLLSHYHQPTTYTNISSWFIDLMLVINTSISIEGVVPWIPWKVYAGDKSKKCCQLKFNTAR